MKPKIIAMYLPQYHSIPENDEFWGKGFTDWVTVKNAKPLFTGHVQPRIPLGNNYYDLSNIDSIKWQASIAKEYGVYGFGIYHYWFNDKKNLLTKPAELIRDNNGIDINYCFAWDNTSWKRSWSALKEGNAWSPLMDDANKTNNTGLLVEYIFGNESSWQNHFNYLLPFFKDKRYIKHDNKPLFLIYHYSPDIERMSTFWDKMAKENGFSGIHLVFRYDKKEIHDNKHFVFRYEPQFSGWENKGKSVMDIIRNRMNRYFGIKNMKVFNYANVWNSIIKNARNTSDAKVYYGAFVAYDDTPRRGERGRVIKGNSPALFKKYMSELRNICKNQGKDYIFLTAWNEWGEGAYLEPDSTMKYQYLESLKEE